MRIARLLAAALAAAIIAVLTASPAWAHNSLTGAVPDKDATVAEAPEQVTLTFLQKVDPKFLTIVVTDAQKNKVPMDAATADGKKGSATFTAPLAEGVYTVAYRVVSEDGHPVQGSYKFTVDDPAAASAEVPSPSAATPRSEVATQSEVATVPLSSEAADDGVGWGPIIAIIAVVALLGGGALLALRRRRTT